MEGESSLSFDILTESCTQGNITTMLPMIEKCILSTENSTEMLQAVKVALCVCTKQMAVNELDNLFSFVCPAAKNILVDKLQYLENNKKKINSDGWDIVAESRQLLTTSLEIVSYFQAAFENLTSVEKMAVSQVGSLLVTSAEVLHASFSHCGVSEEVYGPHFNSLADCLIVFFKKCCDLQENFLNFLSEKLVVTFDDSCGAPVLSEVLSYLSKSGMVLINFEVNNMTMARLWKTYAFLVEKYFSHLKNIHNIGTTINFLSSSIISNKQSISEDFDDQIISKSIKLSCFLLKLLVKLCEIFSGFLTDCHKSLLDVLLTLCILSFSHKVNTQKTSNQDLINRLVLGADPLLSNLLTDAEFMKQCSLFSENLSPEPTKNIAFPILCCLILKKLMHGNSSVRSLWFNQKNNILHWLFLSLHGPNGFYVNHSLPGILVAGKQKQYTDFYEFILVNVSVFLMTATSAEFNLIENILIKNVLQSNPWRAILATDIWCLLARFADSQLCFAQILALSEMLQTLESGTLRVEKRYLIALIRRLFPLMTQSQKEKFLRSFRPSFYSVLWEGHETCNEVDDFNSSALKDINQSILEEVRQSHGEEEIFLLDPFYVEKSLLKCDTGICQKVESLGKLLWSFEYQQLLSNSHSNRFLKMACLVAAAVAPYTSSENLFLILSQVKNLLSCGPSSCLKLYFTVILESLSAVSFPSCKFQQSIVAAIAEIFQELLSSSEVLVKQKSLEVFHRFSHVTCHSEIIGLTVHNRFGLKQEITDYFQKNSGALDLDMYLSVLGEPDFKHSCSFGPNDQDEKPYSKQTKTKDLENIQEIFNKWKEAGEKVVKFIKYFSNSEKKEIRDICDSIITLSESV